MSIFKKKDESSVTAMHYEGIPGFQQDFPCQLSVQEDVLVFNQNGSIVKLPISKINGSEWLMETQYMGKYHNNPVSTAKIKTAMKWFYVIHYEDKFISLWALNSKVKDFVDKIKPSASEITL